MEPWIFCSGQLEIHPILMVMFKIALLIKVSRKVSARNMNLGKVIKIYEIIKNRLPKTYPHPKLAFFEDEDCMLSNTNLKKIENENVYAVFSPTTETICLPLKMTFEYYGKNGKYINTVNLNKFTDVEIAHTLLHECCHMYAGEKYGYFSEKYHDEKYCDTFASRWVKVLVKEKLL